jgi:hypothetical protein
MSKPVTLSTGKSVEFSYEMEVCPAENQKEFQKKILMEGNDAS